MAGKDYTHESVSSGARMTRAEYLVSVRMNAKGRHVCIQCGIEFFRNQSGTNKSNGYAIKYCSMACRINHAAVLRATSEKIPAFVAKEIKAIKRLGKATYKPTKKRCSCRMCGSMFIASLGGGPHKQMCDTCLNENKKAGRKIHKAIRRARERGAYCERVDPISVFDRDKWKCRLCGVNTPRKKRGSTDWNAPELDHIVPLSVGGSHTYSNVQCSCRKCNADKSNRPLGQLWLFG